jgi:hypothetical protein
LLEINQIIYKLLLNNNFFKRFNGLKGLFTVKNALCRLTLQFGGVIKNRLLTQMSNQPSPLEDFEKEPVRCSPV